MTSTEAKPRASKKKQHPGCMVWWFLKDCPLGDTFGVDPFKIYPWHKFCVKYTAFDDLPQCKKYQKKADDKEEEVTKKDEEVVVEDEEQPQPEKVEVVEKVEVKDDDKVATDFDELTLEELEAIISPRREPKERTRRSADGEKMAGYAHAHKNPTEGKRFYSWDLLEAKCRASDKFYGKHKALCAHAMAHNADDNNTPLIARKRMERSAPVPAPDGLQRRYGGEQARHYVQDHPGCFHFYFLPDCPMSALFGVDPFQQYPWEKLCQFRSLQHQRQCFA